MEIEETAKEKVKDYLTTRGLETADESLIIEIWIAYQLGLEDEQIDHFVRAEYTAAQRSIIRMAFLEMPDQDVEKKLCDPSMTPEEMLKKKKEFLEGEIRKKQILEAEKVLKMNERSIAFLRKKLMNNVNCLREEIQGWKEEMENMKAAKESVEEQLRNSRAEYENCIQENTALTNALDEIKKQLDKYRRESIEGNMSEQKIRLTWRDRKRVSLISSPRFSLAQIEVLIKAMKHGLSMWNLRKIANSRFEPERMEEILNYILHLQVKEENGHEDPGE